MSTNGNGQAQPVSINPIEVARLALVFLARADFKQHERQSFDMVEALLQAIVAGKVQLSSPPAAAPLEAPQPEVPS